MASIARNTPITRPTCTLKRLRSPQVRYLSITRPHLAKESEGGNTMRFMPKQQAQSTRMKNLKRSDIPSDVGLAPNTYIRPCGLMPSWFTSPVIRTQLEWLYFKQSITDFLNAVYIARWGSKDPLTNKRKKTPLEVRERCARARELHTQLYNAIAAADRKTIDKIACSGLANKESSRISNNTIKGVEPQSWKVRYRGWVPSSRIQFWLQLLVPSYFKAIHVVADRWMSIPVGPGVMMRQVIARVDSQQTLDRKDGSQPETRDLREYVVVQKFMFDEDAKDQGEQTEQRANGGWMIWGTLMPTDTQAAIEIRNASRSEQGSMADRLRALFPGM